MVRLPPPRHQGHKPAASGKLGKVVTGLLLHPIAPEMLEIPVGPELKEHHDEEHLAEGDWLRASPVPSARDR